MKILVISCLQACFIFLCADCFALSNYGHVIDQKSIFEGIVGDNIVTIMREINNDIDNVFPELCKQEFGVRPGYNHRVLGHWGFESSIPFDKEPYRSLLGKYDKEKLVQLWTDFVHALQKKTMLLTGLPEKQAKSLAAIIYNTHLLSDLQPNFITNKVIDPICDPALIAKDIEKNLHRLFGNNSQFVNEISLQLKAIVATGKQEYASEVLNILFKQKIGEKLFMTYGKILALKNISYDAITAIEQLLRNSEVKSLSSVNENSAKKYFAQKANVKCKVVPGVIFPNGTLVLSLSEGAIAGTFVFFIDSGHLMYQLFKGHMWPPEFKQKILDASIKGAAVGIGTGVMVALGANPAGLVVLGVGTASYFVVNKVLDVWTEYKKGKYLNENDLNMLGIPLDHNIGIVDRNVPLNAAGWN